MTSRTPFVWTRLHLPVPLSADAAHAAIAALAGISGQPRIVLEVSGREGSISWKLGCEARVRTRVLGALGAQLVDLRTEPFPSSLDGLRADAAASLKIAGGTHLSLNRDVVEPITRGVLGALAQARRAELVHLQLNLGPRSRPSRPPEIEPTLKRSAGEKYREHRFTCDVRIAASTADPDRSRRLIEGVVGALRLLEVPGVRIRRGRTSVGAFSDARAPLMWSTTLSISDVVPFTGWPVSAKGEPLPGVPSPHPRLLPPTPEVKSVGRSLGVATSSLDRPIALSVEDSLRHLHLVGPTGVGKSTLIASLALADIAAGRGVVVIDPKGDLVDDILTRADERRLNDIVVLDARDQSPVGINGLSGVSDPDLAADVLLGTFHSLYADAWGPRTHDVLHASLLTLARRGDASLAMVPLLISNNGFRRSIIGQAVKADPMGLGSFWGWWDSISESERSQAAAPLMRRLRPILMRPGIRGILGQRQPKFDLSDVFTKRRIFLVSLAKGVIGPEAAALLGSLVVSPLWMAALARTAIAPDKRAPVMVFIDEVQDYLRLPGDLGDALAQARGLGVGYTLAHQHLGQLPKPLHEAVFANARSRVAFQLGNRDARDIAATTRGALVAEDFESLPAYAAYAQLLTDNAAGSWVSVATQPLPAPGRTAASVRARSQARYGQSLTEIEADLLSLVETRPGRNEPLGRSRRAPDKGGQS
jgi:hypothetical protein